MYSLTKFASRTGRLGTPLATPFTAYDIERITFRHGATSMVAGKPGAGKSIYALNKLVKWSMAGHPVMYFSADSDEFTVARRLGGIISGTPMTEIEHMPPGHLGEILSVDYLKYARFEYRRPGHDEAPADFIADRMGAFEAVHGAFPPIVFVDNLINYAPSSTDWGSMIDFLIELDALSRETMAHICVLHHASESESWTYDPAIGKRRLRTAADPVPRSDIQGKVSQIPRLVLTIAANGSARAVACDKNTNGPDYPDASHFMTFNVEDSLRFTDNYQRMI